MKMLRLGLISRIALLVICVEVVAFSALGWFYIDQFSNAIEERTYSRLHLVGQMIANDDLAISSISRQSIMTDLVGAPYLNGMVIGGNGRVIVSTNPSYLGRIASSIPGFDAQWIADASPAEKFISGNNTLTAIMHTRGALDDSPIYYTVITVSTAELNAMKHSITLWGQLGSLLFILLSSAGIVLIARRVNISLKVLKEVEDGALDARIPISSDDELGQLQHGINSMTAKVGALLNQHRRNEEEMRRLNGQLEQRVAQRTVQLEAANKELEEFSYSMSHSMRSPLLALDGFTKLLLEEHGPSLNDEGKRMLKVLRDNAQRIGRLIDDILHFLSIGRQSMEFSSIDIAKLASETLSELQANTPVRRLQLIIGALPPALGDRDMIREVLRNLLSNAIKFSPADTEAVIEISGVVKENENVYSVTDRGIGFDMRYADKLFRVFERVHSTGQFEGSGIGLALVKRIVTRHGGRVWAEGKMGEGATFHFALPNKRT
jgi:signal transduction histidine kinase